MFSQKKEKEPLLLLVQKWGNEIDGIKQEGKATKRVRGEEKTIFRPFRVP